MVRRAEIIALRSDPKQIDPKEVVRALLRDWDTGLWEEHNFVVEGFSRQ
jgi:hypothetical protein